MLRRDEISSMGTLAPGRRDVHSSPGFSSLLKNKSRIGSCDAAVFSVLVFHSAKLQCCHASTPDTGFTISCLQAWRKRDRIQTM